MKTFKIAANNIDGVFEVNAIPPEVTLIMDGFIDELKTASEHTIYGIVSEQELDEIDEQYGVKRI